MKADFLLFRRKRQKHARFLGDGWCFKNKEQKYLNVETRLWFSPALIKFLATRLVALLVFTKRSCGLLFIWSMWWLLVAVYIGTDQISIGYYHHVLA